MKKYELDQDTMLKIDSIVDNEYFINDPIKFDKVKKEALKNRIIELLSCELFFNHHKDDCSFIQDKQNNCNCGLLEELEMTDEDLDELENLAWQDKNKLVSWFLEFGEYTKEELEAKTLPELQEMANATGITSDFFINYR